MSNSRPERNAYQREYKRQRRLAAGIQPRLKIVGPQLKPSRELYAADKPRYYRLYMRWWNQNAVADEHENWWK
jgi:hypothetical protein